MTNAATRKSRHIRATQYRGYAMPDHRPPSGRHAAGRERGAVWHGTSRVVDRAGKNRANRKSWRKILADARRKAVGGAS